MALITATSTNNWATAFPSVPTAADDVVIPATFTVTIPTATTVVCRSLTTSGTGSLTFTSGTSVLTIGDGTAGLGNVALSIAATSTITLTASSGTINFVSTSATQQTITTNGKTMPSITINGAGSSYILGDALTQVVTGVSTTLDINQGTFDTGNYNITGLIFRALTSSTKTVTLGSSAISMARNGGALDFTGTNLTITANTAVITCTAAATCVMGGVNMNGASLVCASSGTFTLQSGGTWANVTRTGTAVKTDAFQVSVAGFTVTGTLTITSNSDINRVLVFSNTRGTNLTITAAAVVMTNTVDFMDITGAGAATWTVAGTGATYLGDCGGNSGITFTTPATQTATGTASFTWSTHGWTSRVPLPQDDVVINNAFIAGRDITQDMPRMGKNITMSACTGSPRFVNNNTTAEFYGSISFATGMTTFGGNLFQQAGRSSHTITTNGVSQGFGWVINGPGGTYTLTDAFTSTSTFAVTAGSFATANYTMTVLTFSSTGAITRSATLGTSTINITQINAATMWNIASSGLTLSAASSTIVFSTAAFNARVFAGAGLAYGSLIYTVAKSPGALSITGSNSFTTLDVGDTRGLTLAASAVQTVGTFTATGANNGYVYMPGDSGGAYIPDSAATSIANDIDVRLRVALDDVSAAGGKRIAAKYGAAGQRSWRFYISTGNPIFETTNDGTNTAVSAISTQTLAAAGLSSGTTYWLRVARNKAAGTVKFYYAPDNVTVPSGAGWTQIGSTLSGLSTAAIFDSTAVTAVGGETSGTNSNPGKYYRMQVCSNLLDDGSAIQADIDLATKTFGADTFTESSSNAATVTMANASIYGDGRLAIVSGSAGSLATLNKPSGGPLTTTSDYLKVQDIAITQPLSFFAGANSISVSGNKNVVFGAVGTYTYNQSKAATASSTTITATLPATATLGKLLVAYFESAGTQGSYTPPTGWTQAVTKTESSVHYIYYKISDGTETGITFTQGTSRTLYAGIQEWNGFTGTPTLDVIDSNSAAGAGTSLATNGTNPSNTAQPALAVGMIGTSASMGALVSLTNSFVEDRTMGVFIATANHWFVKELTSTAAVNTTITWTTSQPSTAATLAVFKNVSSSTFMPQVMFMG